MDTRAYNVRLGDRIDQRGGQRTVVAIGVDVAEESPHVVLYYTDGSHESYPAGRAVHVLDNRRENALDLRERLEEMREPA